MALIFILTALIVPQFLLLVYCFSYHFFFNYFLFFLSVRRPPSAVCRPRPPSAVRRPPSASALYRVPCTRPVLSIWRSSIPIGEQNNSFGRQIIPEMGQNKSFGIQSISFGRQNKSFGIQNNSFGRQINPVMGQYKYKPSVK